MQYHNHLTTQFMAIFLFLIWLSNPIFATDKESKKKAITNKASESIKKYSHDETLAISQTAIGNTLGHYGFTLPNGDRINTRQFIGKPLIISMIYTSCYHICPTTTKNLNRVVQKARDVLGEDSFNVITIGFDTQNDTPEAMKYFADAHATETDNWFFLSTDAATMTAMVRDLGFVYTPSPQGFDHLIQASVLDKNAKVYRQVYGLYPKTPHFVEPIKELVFGEPEDESLFSAVTAKVKLFCTVYDPAQDRYVFDYTIFIGWFMGIVMGIIFIRLLIREWRYSNAHKKQ